MGNESQPKVPPPAPGASPAEAEPAEARPRDGSAEASDPRIPKAPRAPHLTVTRVAPCAPSRNATMRFVADADDGVPPLQPEFTRPGESGRARRLSHRPAVATFGPFEILGRLAIGGMAEVYLARRKGGAELLVVKKMLAQFSGDREFVAMFRDEASLGQRLRHPNLVRVLEEGEHDERRWMAMEWVDGEPLGTMVRRGRDAGRLPPRIAAAIAHAIADALDVAHGLLDDEGLPLGLVHRDVSPHNVMVGYDGIPKLLDFGIAKADQQSYRTMTGIVKGKFSYMAPEQCQGHALDARVDLFALGIVLFEALIGDTLYRREHEAQTLKAIVEEPVPSLRAYLPDVAPALDAICRMALAKNPAERYPSAAAMRDALGGYLRRSGGIPGPEAIAAEMRRLFPKEHAQGPALDTVALEADQRPTVAPAFARGRQPARSAFGGAAEGLEGLDLARVDAADHARAKSARASGAGASPWWDPDARLDLPSASASVSAPAPAPAPAPDLALDLARPSSAPPPRLAASDAPGPSFTLPPRVVWALAGAVLVALLSAVGLWVGSAGKTTPDDAPVNLAATVFATSVPPGATVVVDGVARGVTPLDVTPLSAGRHTLELRLEGFETHEAEVTLDEGGFVELQARLDAARLTAVGGEGRLTFGASRPAKVFYQGVLLGETPLEARPVPPGTLELELELEDGTRLRTAVFVRGERKETRAYVDVDELR
ncbi:MAG: serine/threonine-protein kinase [Myxococcota bacterium]